MGIWTETIAQNYDLNYYLETAFKNNPTLKDYQNRISILNIDSARISAGYMPQLSATSNNTFAPVVNGYGYDMALNNGGSFNQFINLNKAFSGNKNKTAQYKTVQIQKDSISNEARIFELDIKRNITNQYLIVYGDWQQYNFNIEINNSLHQQEALLKTLTEHNIYKQTDYLIFLVSLKQQELQIKQLKIQYQTDLSNLNYLCGILDTSIQMVKAPDLAINMEVDEQTSVFGLRYYYYNNDLKNDLDLLKYAYRPKLNAFANAGYSSSFIYDATKNFGFSTGFSATVPIYDGHQRRMLSQKNSILQAGNTVNKDYFERQHRQQKAMLKQQLNSTSQLIDEINQQIIYAKGLVDVNFKLLEKGDVKIADYIIALNNYLSAKNLLTLNQINKWQIINQLNYWNN